MRHVKKFEEIYELFNIHNPLSKEKLPYCVDMENKGYRIAYLNPHDEDRFAFDKNFELDDDVYWLGTDNEKYKFGFKYVVDKYIYDNKNKLPFYNLYCKCDPSPNEAQQEMIKKRNKEIIKNQEETKKKIIPGYKPKKEKKQSFKR